MSDAEGIAKAAKTHRFDGETLDLAKVARLSRGNFIWDLTPEAWDRVAEGRAIVESAVADGVAYYGVNTGVGSQKDASVSQQDFSQFNDHVIVAEATNIPGRAFDPKVVRAALAVMLNNAATGRLGLRPELVARMLRLSHCKQMPKVRRNTSSGMADLGPLAQLALPLVGRSLDGDPPLIPGPYDLAAKEAVSLINSNAFTIGHAALVFEEVRHLIAALDLAAATTFEAFRANLNYYTPEARVAYRNRGQIRSCERIAMALDGSSLWEPSQWRLLQDPLSFRFAMRINGSVEAAWDHAVGVYSNDLNTVCDNPIVSLEQRALVTGINMDTSPLTAVTDMLRQTLAMAAAASTERSLKCQNPAFSGLPTGLAKHGHADGGLQNLIVSYLSVARQAELRGLAAPVLLDCGHALADGIEDISGLGPLSVHRTEQVIEIIWQIVTIEMLVAVWAIAVREIPPRELGKGTGTVFDTLRPLLPIGSEGKADFDIEPLIILVRDQLSR